MGKSCHFRSGSDWTTFPSVLICTSSNGTRRTPQLAIVALESPRDEDFDLPVVVLSLLDGDGFENTLEWQLRFFFVQGAYEREERKPLFNLRPDVARSWLVAEFDCDRCERNVFNVSKVGRFKTEKYQAWSKVLLKSQRRNAEIYENCAHAAPPMALSGPKKSAARGQSAPKLRSFAMSV